MGITKGTTSQSPSMTRLLEIQNEKEDGRQKDNGGDDDDDLLKLHDAVCEEDLDEIAELVEEDDGKLVFHQDDEQNTPLHTVCLRGHFFIQVMYANVYMHNKGMQL